jgi:YVTN family beta-propeller protein
MSKKIIFISFVIVIILLSAAFFFKISKSQIGTTTSLNQLGLKQLADIPLSGGTNRWDYQSTNYNNNRLYISHLGSNTVTVFDLKNSKIIKDIPLTSSPYGILVVPESNAVYVGVGGNNQVAVVDEKTLEVRRYVPAGDTPDGIAYDHTSNKVFVSNENGGTVTVIDAAKNQRVEDIPIGGSVGNTHFDSISKKVYSVSGQDATLVEIDPIQNKVIKKYDTAGCSHPHGFYIDEQTHYAFITCQGNNKMVVFDLGSKKIIYSDTVGSDPDVLAFDPGLHRLYVAAESGVLATFNVQKNKISKLGQGFIADKAHTVSVDKNTHKLYLPLENVNGKPVLRVYEPL